MYHIKPNPHPIFCKFPKYRNSPDWNLLQHKYKNALHQTKPQPHRKFPKYRNSPDWNLPHTMLQDAEVCLKYSRKCLRLHHSPLLNIWGKRSSPKVGIDLCEASITLITKKKRGKNGKQAKSRVQSFVGIPLLSSLWPILAYFSFCLSLAAHLTPHGSFASYFSCFWLYYPHLGFQASQDLHQTSNTWKPEKALKRYHRNKDKKWSKEKKFL